MSKRRAPEASAPSLESPAPPVESVSDELAVVDVTEASAPSLEWRNASQDTVRIELCSLDGSVVHPLTIAPGQRLRAPAIYADMVRTRAPQMILEG